jgi:WD40 repeat protein
MRTYSGSASFYQYHQQDIRRFLEKRVNFSTLLYSAEEMTEKCNGMFLYAFYIAKILQNPAQLDGDIFPENINDYFRKNFERVCEKVGKDFCKKLFGCALVAPSPLPVSFISFLLQRENSSLDEQKVIDAISQFVTLRTTDKTFAFLHSLIPAWLTDEQKASGKLFIDRVKANAYFRSIIVQFLNAFLQQGREPISFAKPDLVYYTLGVGFRFVCKCCVRDSVSSQTVFDCLTNYRFLQQRIQSNRIGIYSLIEDLEFSVLDLTFDETEKVILDDICSVLKRDKYVIVGCPELLHSCLSNASKLVQEKIMPNKVSASRMELGFKNLLFSTSSTLRNLDCCAFSHDKRLFAGGKDRCIFLYDARTFERVSDPVELMVENLSHLEFSPDDKFVFFGRLGKWFSVEEKRVVEITQFSGNTECYDWGSYIDDGNYIAVRGKISKINYIGLRHLFFEWALEEFGLSREDVMNESFEKRLLPFFVKRAFLALTLSFEQFKCHKFELGSPVRDSIVRSYANIFEYQIWNVNTGRSVLDEMFSLQLKPFFYLWHIIPAIKDFENKIGDAGLTICNVALLIAVHRNRHMLVEVPIGTQSYNPVGVIRDLVDELFNEKSGKCSVVTESEGDKSITSLRSTTIRDVDVSYLVTNTLVECYNPICKWTNVSKNGKWLAMKDRSEIKLFEKINEGGNGKAEQYLLHSIQKVREITEVDVGEYLLMNEETVFHDIQEHDIEKVPSHSFVYIRLSRNQNLYAFSLPTGTKLCSVSGLFPVRCVSEEGQSIGFSFGDANERITVLLRDLPGKFLLNCKTGVSVTSKPVAVTFTPAHTIMILCSDAKFALWKFDHSDLVMACDTKMLELDYSEKISIEKFVFSHDGKLIAIHHSCQILLFNWRDLCSVVKVIEECEYTVPCLTFSPDDSLLLFCIQKSTSDQTFYVWDVKKEVLTDPILLTFPYVIHVDCCCFSSDNSKLFFCNASSVLILEYPSKVVSCRTITVPPYVNSRSDTCSHCTVSSDNMLLAWCVANEMFIYSLNGSDAFWKVPHNHLGKVEYCDFLRGNRYLISYGIDDVVFLFDLVEGKSIAYVRLESIISMALSADEDKAVCLESSGKVSVINMYGLKRRLPPDFKLPSDFRLHAQINHEPQGTQIIAAPFQPETAVDDCEFIIDDDDRMSFCSSRSSDEDVADEIHFTSDHSADHFA